MKLDHTQFSYRKLLKIWSDPSRKLPVSLESDYSDSLLHYERLCLIVRSHEPILWESVPDWNAYWILLFKPRQNQVWTLLARSKWSKWNWPKLRSCCVSTRQLHRDLRSQVLNEHLLHGHISAVRGWCLSQSSRRTCRSCPMPCREITRVTRKSSEKAGNAPSGVLFQRKLPRGLLASASSSTSFLFPTGQELSTEHVRIFRKQPVPGVLENPIPTAPWATCATPLPVSQVRFEGFVNLPVALRGSMKFC